MTHRKQKHRQTVAYCKKKLEGSCPFTDEKCWWNHQDKPIQSTQSIECFICSEIFADKSSLMKHRKSEHASIIKRCEKFLQNDCPFQSSSCWHLHEEEDMEIDESLNSDKNKVTEDYVK